MKKKFLGVHISSDSIKTFDVKKAETLNAEENRTSRSHSAYAAFSKDEIILLAKKDPNAMDEAVGRMQELITRYAAAYVRDKPYVDKDDVEANLRKTIVRSIEIYEPEKGDFIHLMKKMIHFTLKEMTKKEAMAYYKEMRYFGDQLRRYVAASFADSEPAYSQESEIVFRVDFNDYMKTVSADKKEMMLMYIQGMSFREIGDVVRRPASTVSYQIYMMLDDLGLNLKK